MKTNKILLLIILGMILSCNQEKEVNYVVITGTVENPIKDSLKILDYNYKLIKTIYLSKDNKFNDTLFVDMGYYFLGDWNSTKQLFLKPSFNLNTTIKYSERESSIIFDGNGANENNYLQKKESFYKTFRKVEDYQFFMSLNEDDFLKLSDSIKNEKTQFFNTQVNLDNDFNYFELFSLKYDNSNFINRYSQWKGSFLGDENFKVSENFPNPFDKYNISDEKLIKHPNYLSSIFQILSNKHKIIHKYPEIDLKFINILDKEISIQKIKDKMVYNYVKDGIEQTKELEAVYTRYMEIVKNETYRDEIKKTYANLNKIAKGTKSPTFELFDVNNNLVTLESLKDKLVYIDIWGTWCIPCIEEIPALKQIEKEFRGKDINFVSICIRDDKETFKKFVKEQKLPGIQLFAPDLDISFFKDYQLKSVPRYILIDKEGKIIDANAYKPSDPKLKKQLLELL